MTSDYGPSAAKVKVGVCDEYSIKKTDSAHWLLLFVKLLIQYLLKSDFISE